VTKAKLAPEYALTPRRDPLLDDLPAARFARAFGRWTAAIVGTLTFLAVAGELQRADMESDMKRQAERLQAQRREIADLQHQLALRAASGNCSTLFYLIEANDMQTAGEKLRQASMRIADAVNTTLYPSPLPPLTVQ
jgi:hypothetical protein